MEAPLGESGELPLANFGSVKFTGATATINSVTDPIDGYNGSGSSSLSWQSAAINMSDGSAGAATSPLTDSSGQSQFTVTYESSGDSPAPTYFGALLPGVFRGGIASTAQSMSGAIATKLAASSVDTFGNLPQAGLAPPAAHGGQVAGVTNPSRKLFETFGGDWLAPTRQPELVSSMHSSLSGPLVDAMFAIEGSRLQRDV